MEQDWLHMCWVKQESQIRCCVQGLPRQHHQVWYVANLRLALKCLALKCLECQQLMQKALVYIATGLLSLAHAGNAFGIYPKTGWRTASIILMIGHQAVAFMLFVRISSLRLCWQAYLF